MMWRTALWALLSHWRKRPFQALTLILGLALATALWSGVQAINAEARASYDAAAEALGGPAESLARADGNRFPETIYVDLRRAGWLGTPVIEGWLNTPNGRVKLFGIDPVTARTGTAAADAAIDSAEGFFSESGLVLASPSTAERLDGSLIPVETVDGLAPGIAFADIGIAQRLLDAPGQIDRIILQDTQPLRQSPLTDVAPSLELRVPDTGGDLGRLTDSFHLNLTAFGLLSFAVGLFIVHGAIGLAFEQRRPTFRTLRALGVPARTLALILAGELFLFAVIAGLIGIVLGYMIAAALLPNVAATLRGLYGASIDGALTIRPEWWLAGLGIAVLGTAVASIESIAKVARLPVLAPARPRAWALASDQTLLIQFGAAIFLAVIAALAGLFGSGLVAGFTMLGCLLLAAALLLPPVLSVILRLAQRTANTARAEWFWADTRQQLPGLNLALMALLLALAANIGVGTMVSSFRLTFTGWLDQRLASELYVTAESEEQSLALQEWLVPRTDAILPIWNVETEIFGRPGEIYGIIDHQTYRDNWPLLDDIPNVWNTVAEGGAALINEQMARAMGLAAGDEIALPGVGSVTVGGVYSDYGNPAAQVIVSNDRLLEAFPDVERLRFGLRIPPEQTEDLSNALIQEFGLSPGSVIDQASIKAFSLEVFERTFAVTAALNVLTLAVAGFAILTSLLTLAGMRLPQLAPVWALGLTRKDLAKTELTRALFLAFLTFCFAIPVGLVLAWVLLAVINVEAFGWRLPMFLFPRDWLILGMLALIAAGLASLWPALRLTRMAPSDLLKVFAHER